MVNKTKSQKLVQSFCSVFMLATVTSSLPISYTSPSQLCIHHDAYWKLFLSKSATKSMVLKQQYLPGVAARHSRSLEENTRCTKVVDFGQQQRLDTTSANQHRRTGPNVEGRWLFLSQQIITALGQLIFQHVISSYSR